MKKVLATAVAAAIALSTVFVGTASAAPTTDLELIPGTNLNVCLIADLEDFVDLQTRLKVVLGSDLLSSEADSLAIPGPTRGLLDSLRQLETRDLNLLGLDLGGTDGDIYADVNLILGTSGSQFTALRDRCDDVVVVPPTSTNTTTPSTTTTTARPSTTVVVPDVVVETTRVRVPVVTDFTVPSGSVDTGAP